MIIKNTKHSSLKNHDKDDGILICQKLSAEMYVIWSIGSV